MAEIHQGVNPDILKSAFQKGQNSERGKTGHLENYRGEGSGGGWGSKPQVLAQTGLAQRDVGLSGLTESGPYPPPHFGPGSLGPWVHGVPPPGGEVRGRPFEGTRFRPIRLCRNWPKSNWPNSKKLDELKKQIGQIVWCVLCVLRVLCCVCCCVVCVCWVWSRFSWVQTFMDFRVCDPEFHGFSWV